MQISEATAFLENAYVALNKKFFGGELPPVIITIQSSQEPMDTTRPGKTLG